jgi:hypothetical protein
MGVLLLCSLNRLKLWSERQSQSIRASIARIIVVGDCLLGTWSHRQRSRQTPWKVYYATERKVMGLFSDLLSRIRGHADTAAPTAASTLEVPADTPSSDAPAPPATPAPPVDVATVLNGLASAHAETLDWQHSIVDLLKLVGMDSSLAARKELAADLNYTGELDGSAAMNIWLHKEVMKKLAENGGKVPPELLH